MDLIVQGGYSMSEKSLVDKVVLITGASSGIGKATALVFANCSANLVLASRNLQKLKEVEAKTKQAGVRVMALRCDITSRADVHNVVQKAVEDFGRIDIAVCNAGMYFRKPAVEQSIDEVRGVMETNFFGTLNCIYEVLPLFLAEKMGHIVVTSSLDGKKGLPIDSAYSASKAALTGFMESLRQELRHTSIHISAVFPGRTDTPMIENITLPSKRLVVPPEKVAKAILKAVVRNKREVLVPYLSSKVYVLVDSISPRMGDSMVRILKLEGKDITPPAKTVDRVNL
jgi:short-subunit dehydrogenase